MSQNSNLALKKDLFTGQLGLLAGLQVIIIIVFIAIIIYGVTCKKAKEKYRETMHNILIKLGLEDPAKKEIKL